MMGNSTLIRMCCILRQFWCIVPYKKRPRQDFQSDLESSSGRLEKAGKMDLGETQLMDARRLVRENNTMFLNG